MYQYNIHRISVLQDAIFNERKKTPISLQNVILFNYEEQTLSDCYYEEMFDKFLQNNNYINKNKNDYNVSENVKKKKSKT